MYILAGFYICFPLKCFPLISIKNFHISKIYLLSFSISMYHIFCIFHCLDRFSSSLLISSLPASRRYFFQSVSNCLPCSSVNTFSQFVASYFPHIFFVRYHIPFFFPLDSFSAFLFQFFNFHSFSPLSLNFRTIA